ncbi:MAG: hypothetical protein ABS88_13235 [Sphingopyxis sp. SCN 67-31]|nr:MAG: hypothetical protein ABS88_13235 [Sphingopyxis sp. SCN 67-31]
MDQDKRDLVNQLCTQTGMIMEDCSTVALTIVGASNEEIGDRISRLQSDAERLGMLIKAAHSLAVST